MTSDFERNLEKYAEVIVKIGLNLQPGQRLLIGPPLIDIHGVPIELTPLIREITKKAYQIGARFVDVMWEDDQLRLIRFQHAPHDSFKEFPNWRTDEASKIALAGDAILWIASWNSELLDSQDPELITKFFDECLLKYKLLLDLRHKNVMNHTIVAAPIVGWADKLFPDLSQNERTKKLWDVIFEICRVKQEDPISAWRYHINQLRSRCNFLNQKHYKALKFVGPGTDLTTSLPKGHIWRSGGFKTQSGIEYVGNIPTEEVFTIPHKDKIEGVVTATKPLFAESMIENFSLTFSKGQVIKATAKKGEKVLKNLLKKDNGARYLGEVALVPHSSPISKTGMIFYRALFDENASCHLALGQCLRMCIVEGEKVSEDELLALGGNVSNIHSDFMIGSDKMNVDGILDDGTTESIMRNGEWVFNV